MNTTFALGNGLKVIDLTKPLDPKTESRRCHLIRYNTGGPIPDPNHLKQTHPSQSQPIRSWLFPHHKTHSATTWNILITIIKTQE